MENILNKRYDIHKTFEYNKEKGPFEKIYDNQNYYEIIILSRVFSKELIYGS